MPLIAVCPRSGTNFIYYFVGVYEAALDSDVRKIDDAVIQRIESPHLRLGVGPLGVGHVYCPGFEDTYFGALREAWERLPSAETWNVYRDWVTGNETQVDPTLSADARIVFVYRNPFDQIVSLHRHEVSHVLGSEFENIPLREAYLRRLDIYIKFTFTYFRMREFYPENFLFVRYEDLVAAPADNMGAILRHIGHEVDLEALERAVAMTTPSELRSLELRLGHTLASDQKGSVTQVSHMRGGDVGKWKANFDPTMIRSSLRRLTQFHFSIQNFSGMEGARDVLGKGIEEPVRAVEIESPPGLSGMPTSGLPLFQDEGDLWQSYDHCLPATARGEKGRLLDFLVVSPPASGTSWLVENMRLHPQIFLPGKQELRRFDTQWLVHHIELYLDQIARAQNRVAGDVSPSYALLPDSMIREIQSHYPKLKLIYVMRDPIVRAWFHARHSFSAFEANFRNRVGRFEAVSDRDLLQNFLHDLSLSCGDYQATLRRWMQYFPTTQFHLAFAEDIVAHPHESLRNIFQFLEVDDATNQGSVDTRHSASGDLAAQIPPGQRRLLSQIYRPRTKALQSVLRKNFKKTPPWPTLETQVLPPIWLMDHEPDLGLYFYEGEFLAIRKPNAQLTPLGVEEMLQAPAGTYEIIRANYFSDLIQLVARVSSGFQNPVATESMLENRRLLNLLSHLVAANRLLGSQVNMVRSRAREATVPILVQKETETYNVISAGDTYLAISKTIGAVAPLAEKLGERELGDLIIKDADLTMLLERIAVLEKSRVRPTLQMVQETQQFNILKSGEDYLALAKSLGPVDVMAEKLGEREMGDLVLKDEDVARLMSRVSVLEQARIPRTVELVRETDLYNILMVGSRYLAVAKALGPVDLMMEKLGEREMGDLILKDEDVDHLMSRIAVLEQSRARPTMALVQESELYNILRVGDSFLALAKSLGPVDLMREKLGERDVGELVLRSSELSTLQERVGVIEHAEAERVVELVATTPLYNLVRAGGSYVAVAKELGPVSIMVDRLGHREVGTMVLKDKSLEALQRRVEQIEQRGTRAEAAD